MKITPINTGFFKLDGGAMFGVVPKKLWSRVHPADEHNMCTWAMRALLVETGNRKIIIDTGIGQKQDERFQHFFEPTGQELFLENLKNYSVNPEEITDVFFTHLHFDHSGGALSKDKDGKIIPTFPNATYWTNDAHWAWALHPSPREIPSYLQENFVPLQEMGLLKMLEVENGLEFCPGFHIEFVYGHTHAMMLPVLTTDNQKYIYCADLIPSSNHLNPSYVMAYDNEPLKTMQERKVILEKAIEEDCILIFEHDPETVMGKVWKNERGRFLLKQEG